jgi:hypothetical protein
MFCRTVTTVLVSSLLCVTAASCKGKASPAPAAQTAPNAGASTPGAPNAAETPTPTSPAHELTPPAGYHSVPAKPPLADAWEGPAGKNGFTPTLNVTFRPAFPGTPDESYAQWRDELMGVLKKNFQDVKVMAERPFEAGGGKLSGKLVITAVSLPMPGGKMPMQLFTYGATFQQGDAMWVLAAITGADLDVRSGNITPADEPEILSALASFHLR